MREEGIPVVIVRPVDISGDDGGEVAAVLLVVAAVQHVDHALGVRVSYTITSSSNIS